MDNLPGVQLGVILAIALGAVELGKLGVTAAVEAYRKSGHRVEDSTPGGPAMVCPLNNGQTKAVIEWLKTINHSLEPLAQLSTQVTGLTASMNAVRTDITTIKARQDVRTGGQ